MYAALFGSMVALSLWGCKKRNTAEQQKTATRTESFTPDTGNIILGERLINPYTVDNMQRAKKSLEEKGIYPKNAYTVKETHLYVKFKPKNVAAYNELRNDTILRFVDLPMDYDIKVIGSHYREPGLKDNVPTPQYTTIPSDYVFNKNIDYEIVARMYLPEWDYTLMSDDYYEDYEYLRQLLMESYAVNPPNSRWNMKSQPEKTKKAWFCGSRKLFLKRKYNTW